MWAQMLYIPNVRIAESWPHSTNWGTGKCPLFPWGWSFQQPKQPRPAEVWVAHIWVTTEIQWSSCTGAHPRGPIQEEMHSTVKECLRISPAGQLCSNIRTMHWEHPVTAVLSFLVPLTLPLPSTDWCYWYRTKPSQYSGGEEKDEGVFIFCFHCKLHSVYMNTSCRKRSWSSTWRSREWSRTPSAESAGRAETWLHCSCFDRGLLPALDMLFHTSASCEQQVMVLPVCWHISRLDSQSSPAHPSPPLLPSTPSGRNLDGNPAEQP